MIRFKDDLEDAKKRINLWWDNKEADRPLLQIMAPREEPVFSMPAREAADIHEYWTHPEVSLPRLFNTLGATFFGGEAIPLVYPVPGRIVSITCKYLGAPNRYIDESTTWSEHIIHDWDNCPPLSLDKNGEWWNITMRNMNLAGEIIRENELECFMGLPDLNGPTEVLSGLRNPEKMCMDLIMEPERVLEAARKVQDAWYEAWKETAALSSPFGTYSSFMGIWSEIPATDLQSDFSSLISAEMFEQFIYPFVREQAQRFPRTVFHLDGPDMIRHLDILLEDENINAIQWVFGAGAGRATDWIDLMKRIQKGGKALYVYCEEDEVLTLADKLDPKGLMMVVTEGSSEKAARELLTRLGGGGS
ncbi:MAG: hypothetical protein PQJ58_13045 [Spirochaetales bacterium]|nr:hypothetical protein [Spirochaetales bacterium]